jgi:hypothetical protein
MKTSGIIILLCVSAQAAEVWLTKERTAQLRAITSRPYITKKIELGNGVEELHWTNGSRSWVTTQEVRRVAGAKAAHGWQKKLDAEKAARKEIIDNIKALATKGSATKKELDALAAKTEKQQETKERQP